MKFVSIFPVMLVLLGMNTVAQAAGCAAEISAWRRAHGLSAVRADAALDRLAARLPAGSLPWR